MLGYAIRICDERGDTFYKNKFNLLNNYIVGELLQDARVFLDKQYADTKLEELNKFLESPFQNGSIKDFISKNNSEFNGFEVVEVSFDELYFTILLKCVDNHFTHVKSIEYDELGAPQIKLSVEAEGCQRFFAYKNADDEIRKLDICGFHLSKNLKIRPTFVNIKVFE